MTTFYRRHLPLVVLLFVLIVLLFLQSLCCDIPDGQLDAHALSMHSTSSFNPRSLTYCVYSYLRSLLGPEPILTANLVNVAQLGNQNGIYFHWDDWVDLLPADKHLDHMRTLYPDGKCDGSLRDFASVNAYYMESYNTKVARGMVNLYCVKDVPKRILVLMDSGFVEIPVLGRHRIGLGSMPQHITKHEVVQEMEQFHLGLLARSTSSLRFHPFKQMQKDVDIAPEDFIFDVDTIIFTLKEAFDKNTILPNDFRYLQFLETANTHVDVADRFFKYPWIYTDLIAGRSHHLSFPFFKRYISNRERQAVLHHMVRVWFKFAESQNVKSWVNYGSLLGWAYNGVNMPWDTDIDVQLPIAQLDRLSRRFNSTIIIENPRDGNAKYLFEVAPTYVREGNGRNFIDARFIDINSGLYIDISALSYTNHLGPAELDNLQSDMSKLRTMPVHCKNWNWHTLDELLPIRHTYFEGASVYIPRNVLSILLRKYGTDSFTTKFLFNNHRYRRELLLWVPKNECMNGCSAVLSFLGMSKWLAQCRNQWLEDETRIVKQSAERHMQLNYGPDEPTDYEPSSYDDLLLVRKDPWDYFNDINNKYAASPDWYVAP